MNTIQQDHDDEPVSNVRSFDFRKGGDQWGATTRSLIGSGRVGGGGRAGKESAVNAGDLSGKEVERLPAGVRAAIVASMAVKAEGAKGGRRWIAEWKDGRWNLR